MTTALWVYITAQDRDQARTLADALVEGRLAACVNILGPIESVYRWQGKVERDAEVALVAKTTADRLAQLTETVRQLHSYACPCVLALPAAGGNADFLQWIAEQVRSGGKEDR